MKKLLLSCLLFAAGGSSAFAQATCAAATNIAANGTFTTGAINGTYVNPCFGGTTDDGGAPIKAKWWKYTPTANGEITVTTVLAANPVATTDTRVAILKGTCGAQTCVDSNDDVSGTDYRSTVTVPVASGTTYYIEFDSYWAATTFTFQFTFTATPCVRPGKADFYRPENYTTSAASLFWNNAIGTPANYDIDWSTNFTDAAGAGTIVSVPAGATTYTQGDITGLPESLNFRYYVRSNCGATQSAWQGPFYGYLAVPLPYSNDFESAANNYTDGFIGFSRFNSTATSNPADYADGGAGVAMYTFNSTTAVSNAWAYSRAVTLAAGEEVTIAFKTRLYSAGAPSDMTLDVTVGNEQSTLAQTTVVGTATANDAAAYQDQLVTWTAPSAGVYYFGFHNVSAIGAAQTFMFFDTLDITSVLSNNDFISSKVSVYPNPTTNVVNISSTVNATIGLVEMTDMNGRVIKSIKVNATEGQISVSDLATGMYMMKITTDQGVATKKIVKQ